MKIAICKPFRRIGALPRNEPTFSSDLNKMIINFLYKSGHDVDIWTTVSKMDNPISVFGHSYKMIDIPTNYKNINDYGYDVLMVISSTPNFYGGIILEDKSVNIYHMINSFKGKVLLYLDDAQLVFRKDISGVNGKKSAKRKYSDQETIIERPVHIITTYKDFSIHRKNNLEYIGEEYFPMEKIFLTNDNKINRTWNKSYDLGYGGALKPNRIKYFKKYFFDNHKTFKTNIFAFLKTKQYESFISNGDLSSCKINIISGTNFKYYNSQLNKSYASPIFGDFRGEVKIIPLRIYQTLYAGCIQLIDRSFDTKESIFPNLKDLVYISDKNEAIEKIEFFKSLSPDKYFKIIEDQLEAIKMDENKIYEDLNNIIFDSLKEERQPIIRRKLDKVQLNLEDLF